MHRKRKTWLLNRIYNWSIIRWRMTLCWIVCKKISPPDYVIIWAQKCGTTSLYKYLKDHPGVASPQKKETQFFTWHYQRGIRWYLAHFPIWRKGRMVGEATPYYLYHPLVAKRMKKHFPKIKIIVMLRDPVRRAYSEYKMAVEKWNERLSFASALDVEKDRLEGANKTIRHGGNSHNHKTFSYASRGLYHEQIQVWLKHFDRKQICFVKSEDFRSYTEEGLEEIHNFLGLAPRKLWAVRLYNEGKSGAFFEDEETFERLKRFFMKDQENLADLLWEEFRWWQ